jgi:hypothetical protein
MPMSCEPRGQLRWQGQTPRGTLMLGGGEGGDRFFGHLPTLADAPPVVA